MSAPSESALRPVLRIDFPPEQRLGRGKIELLERIADTGSISAAGRAMDMSYRRAWLLVDEMNRMFKRPVVESQRGGKRGGGATISDFGREIVMRFRRMERHFAAAAAEDLRWLESNRSEKIDAPSA